MNSLGRSASAPRLIEHLLAGRALKLRQLAPALRLHSLPWGNVEMLIDVAMLRRHAPEHDRSPEFSHPALRRLATGFAPSSAPRPGRRDPIL